MTAARTGTNTNSDKAKLQKKIQLAIARVELEQKQFETAGKYSNAITCWLDSHLVPRYNQLIKLPQKQHLNRLNQLYDAFQQARDAFEKVIQLWAANILSLNEYKIQLQILSNQFVLLKIDIVSRRAWDFYRHLRREINLYRTNQQTLQHYREARQALQQTAAVLEMALNKVCNKINMTSKASAIPRPMTAPAAPLLSRRSLPDFLKPTHQTILHVVIPFEGAALHDIPSIVQYLTAQIEKDPTHTRVILAPHPASPVADTKVQEALEDFTRHFQEDLAAREWPTLCWLDHHKIKEPIDRDDMDTAWPWQAAQKLHNVVRRIAAQCPTSQVMCHVFDGLTPRLMQYKDFFVDNADRISSDIHLHLHRYEPEEGATATPLLCEMHYATLQGKAPDALHALRPLKPPRLWRSGLFGAPSDETRTTRPATSLDTSKLALMT